MKHYEQIDTTGDVGLKVWGEDIERLFENAAEGMFSLITDTSRIISTEQRDVQIIAENKEDLLIKWLNELVFLFDTYNFIAKTSFVTITRNSSLSSAIKETFLSKKNSPVLSLTGQISGGTFDPEQNESRLLVKAATYHDLSIKKSNNRWEAMVLFDI